MIASKRFQPSRNTTRRVPVTTSKTARQNPQLSRKTPPLASAPLRSFRPLPSVPRRFYVAGDCDRSDDVTPKTPKKEFKIYKRLANMRGSNDFNWLQTHYTFSFSPFYKEPNHRGFRKLRVLNDDVIQPSGGFETHGHVNMEILTYVLDGTLEHKDSLGNGSVIKPNEIQLMCAGRGIQHSEFNPSSKEACRLLQIWIMPHTLSLQPGYQQTTYDPAKKQNQLMLLATPNPSATTGPALKINQDVNIFASVLAPQKQIDWSVVVGRAAWLQVARGEGLKVLVKSREVIGGREEMILCEGDGIGIEGPADIRITKGADDQASEFLLFDLN